MKVLRNIILSLGLAALATACGGSSKAEDTTPEPAATETAPADDMGGDMGDDMGGDDMGGENPCGDMGDNPCGDEGGDDF